MAGTYRIVLFDIDGTLVSTRPRGRWRGGRPSRSSTGYRPISGSTPTRAWPTPTWAHRPSRPSFTASWWFTFGAHAEAGLDRTVTVRQAVQRGEAMVGEDVPDIGILVVGDTRRHVDARHAVGCTALVVATGHHGAAARREADADRVLPTLEQEVLH